MRSCAMVHKMFYNCSDHQSIPVWNLLCEHSSSIWDEGRMIMLKVFLSILFIINILICSSNTALAIGCSGVFQTTLDGEGSLLINGNGLTYLRLCYIATPPQGVHSGNITIDTCKGLYSKFLAAEMAQRSITMIFRNGSAKYCKDISNPWGFPFDGNEFVYIQ